VKKGWKILPSGVNFTNVLLAAFTHVDPKPTDTVELDSLLMLLGSACVKAAHKHVGEIKPRELFTDLSTLNLLTVVWF